LWLASVHLETVLVSVDRCTVFVKCTIGLEIVLELLIVLLVDEAHVDARLVHLEIVLILTQNRCTVCAKRTIRLRNCFGRT
jgi:hypothetical protein